MFFSICRKREQLVSFRRTNSSHQAMDWTQERENLRWALLSKTLIVKRARSIARACEYIQRRISSSLNSTTAFLFSSNNNILEKESKRSFHLSLFHSYYIISYQSAESRLCGHLWLKYGHDSPWIDPLMELYCESRDVLEKLISYRIQGCGDRNALDFIHLKLFFDMKNILIT